MCESFKKIDRKMKDFADQLGGNIKKKENTKYPGDKYENRIIEWMQNGLQFMIGICPTLTPQRKEGWTSRVLAYQDKDNYRYFKELVLIEISEKKEIIKNIDSLLKKTKSLTKDLLFQDLDIRVELEKV